MVASAASAPKTTRTPNKVVVSAPHDNNLARAGCGSAVEPCPSGVRHVAMELQVTENQKHLRTVIPLVEAWAVRVPIT
eukprot:3858714-Prymnesium_polylepis.1